MLTLIPYTPDVKQLWDKHIAASRNGTFLFRRNYMDYHSDRFRDCSLVFMKRDKVIACFPANICESEQTVYSHQGLTYGGLIISTEATSAYITEIFHMMMEYYKQKYSAKRIIYKPTPYIYHKYPSDEELYVLFAAHAKLVGRGLSSTIDLTCPYPYDKSRRRMLRKSQAAGLSLTISDEEQDIREYWEILNETLQRRHSVVPVHTADELMLLRSRFPENIEFHVCRKADGTMLGGCWLYKCNHTVHAQYLTSSDKGREVGATDFMVNEFINSYKIEFRFFDFGISTEDNGDYLNTNLAYHKEGLGGRGVCYDVYEIEIK